MPADGSAKLGIV